MAIEKIWSAGSTSDELANSASYYMIDNRIKINPLLTRTRQVGEDDKIPLRIDFGNMIRNTIYNKWEDNELLDFIDLLGYQAAEVEDVLGHPVLLSPHRRQLMYHRFDTEELHDDQRNWLLANADPGAHWKLVASRSDPTLEKILAYQARIVMEDDDAEQFGDGWLARWGEGFPIDFFGALHFSSVATAHYGQHFKSFTQGNWREEIVDRVDLQLKKVLPRLLTRRYNVNFLP
ncbi:hypothetical protein ACQJBY_047901 [Aegilops geniculata]